MLSITDNTWRFVWKYNNDSGNDTGYLLEEPKWPGTLHDTLHCAACVRHVICSFFLQVGNDQLTFPSSDLSPLLHLVWSPLLCALALL